MITKISDSLLLQRSCFKDKTAIVYKKKAISYLEFYDASLGIADMLKSAGIKKYDRCAIYMEKRSEEAQAIYAINMADGIFIDINHLLKGDQISHILADSSARFLFTTGARLRQIKDVVDATPELELIVVVDETPEEIALEKEMTALPRPDSSGSKTDMASTMVETDPAAIIYTSGSTGKPKGVVVSQRNLVAGAESVTQYLGNTPDDRILSVMPFSFDYGLNQLTSAVHVGCTCVLINYLLINDVIKAVETHQISGLGLIPPLWMQLLQKDWGDPMKNLRYITNTGGAMPETAVKELRKRLPDTDIYLMFGLTEAFRGTFLDPALVDQKPTSVGKAIPNAEIWILNDRMEHCRPFEEGMLVQRGAHVALGYWNDPVKTAAFFRPNPLIQGELQIRDMVVFSGDTVFCDEDGDIYFKCRKDDMIKSSGYRISPTDVEEALYQTDFVRHAAVFGQKDDVLGQKICAVVSLKDNVTAGAKEITASVSKILPNYMMPRQVIIVDELPLNQNGKIDRNRIKKEHDHDE